tara:strand:+ start:740 stop:883 length:144 start_codon:yes stop_codon:yes gene_type:complete
MKQPLVSAAIIAVIAHSVLATYALHKKFLTLRKVDFIECVVNCAALV